MRLKTIQRISLTFLTIAVLTTLGLGQVSDTPSPTSVRITGRVTDQINAAIPNAVVTLKVPETNNIVAEVRADQDGHFSFHPVSPQEYEIRFESPGFEPLRLQVNSAVAGGIFDIGTVVLLIGDWGDRVEIRKQPSTHASPINTTVCELVKEGNHFHGEFIQLRAAVFPGGTSERPRLVDSSCGANVGLDFPKVPSITVGKDLPRLKQYVEQKYVMIATVSGKFELVPVYHGKLTYTLKLESASDLVVTLGAVSGSRRTR
jgi:hypothetical protein